MPAATFTWDITEITAAAETFGPRATAALSALLDADAEVDEAIIENWHHVGAVNLNTRTDGPRYRHEKYVRRMVISGDVEVPGDFHEFALEIVQTRLGKAGKVRETFIKTGEAHTVALDGNLWAEAGKSLRARGYSKGQRTVEVLTETPAAQAVRSLLG